jgi:cyanophycinase
MFFKSILLFLFPFVAFSQNYTSYFTGNTVDKSTSPEGGICMMGGRTEDDQAMKWFLNRAKGGDILVLRASGSNGYNDYMYSELGVSVNSVESIVFNNRDASFDSKIIDKINKAEAIWFAGGDQWKYISYWRDTPLNKAINDALANRKIVIGGTSAGMAILGQYYFTAENGTITSADALANPYSTKLTIDSVEFLNIPLLKDIITDTHFENPDRRGRLLTFIARVYKDTGKKIRGIACDEYSAICIDTEGTATVYGKYPAEDDNAYFIVPNCELLDGSPEICQPNKVLTWHRDGKAAIVFAAKGTPNGSHQIQLKDWKTTLNGEWKYWSVKEGTFSESIGTKSDCIISSLGTASKNKITIYPNPTYDKIYIVSNDTAIDQISISNLNGKKILTSYFQPENNTFEMDTRSLTNGIYLVNMYFDAKLIDIQKLVKL